MRSFDLRLLEAFVVLVDEGLHFRGAAERLGIGQPRLSQQMARLQRQLTTSLIVRGERRNLLTPAGARFLTHARAVLQRASALSAELHAASDTLRIHMGVGAHQGACGLVTSFMTAHPSTRVEIAEGPSSNARHALLRHAVDVAFELRTGCPPEMRFELVDRSPLGLLTGPEHPVARCGSATWGDLNGERILFDPEDGGSWNALVRGCLAAARVVVTEEIAPPVPRLHYLVPIVAGGTASLITGRELFEPLPPGLTWTVLAPLRHLEFGAMWNPRRSTRALDRFIAHVRRHSARVSVAPPMTGPTAPDPVPTGPARDADDAVSQLGFDLRLVLPFVTVAEEMHFGRAAERLMTAQPALSRQVARLESQLGAQLLIRSSRSIDLTEAGHLALAAGRDILDRANRAQISANSGTAVVGRLDVRSSHADDPALVRLLASFRTGHPAIAVHIRDGGAHRAVEAVADGAGDIGVCAGPVAPPGLRYLKVADVEQGLRCPDTHPLARHRSIRWSDLNGEVLHVPASGVAENHGVWLRGKLAEHGVTVAEVETPGAPAPLGMADMTTGRAVAVTASHDVGLVPHPRWVPFDPPEYVEQGVVWNDDTTNPAVRSFLGWISSGDRPE